MIPEWLPLQGHLSLDSTPPFRLTSHWTRLRRYLSAASSWEIAIKHAIGKLPLPEPPAVYVPERMRLSGFEGPAVSHVHALAVADLPPHHRDPFDRILDESCQSAAFHTGFDPFLL